MICRQCKQDRLPGYFIWKKNARVAYGQTCIDCCRENWQKPEWKERQRDNNLRRTHGIGLKAYNDLLEKQEGKCALCKQESKATGKNSKLHVDHDHKTGKIRGLLCYGCNLAIGFLDEDLEKVYKVIEYLNLHQGVLKNE